VEVWFHSFLILGIGRHQWLACHLTPGKSSQFLQNTKLCELLSWSGDDCPHRDLAILQPRHYSDNTIHTPISCVERQMTTYIKKCTKHGKKSILYEAYSEIKYRFVVKKKSSKVSYKILLLPDSAFFKLFFHIFAAIIEVLIVAGHNFLYTLLIECGRLRC